MASHCWQTVCEVALFLKARRNIMRYEHHHSNNHDPICGMAVTAQFGQQLTCHGRTYYFCSVGCKHKFDVDLAHYGGDSLCAIKRDSPSCCWISGS